MRLLFSALLVPFAFSMALGAETGDPAKVKPLQTMAGGDSSIHHPMVRLIPDQPKWAELWNIHKGAIAVVSDKGEISYPDAPKPPLVDFAKNQVLVVFGGKLPNVQAYDYVKTLVKDDTAVIQLSQNFVPATADLKTYYPFILLVIPKEPVKIEVQLDSIAKDASHFWMTIASYGIPKAAKGLG
jgi:hypothetical protein